MPADGDRSPLVRAAVLVAPDTFELRNLPRPPVTPEGGLVAVEVCGICGTDLKIASGAVAAPLPLILGHEIVGRITELGAEAAARRGLAVGDRVLVESSLPCGTCDRCRDGDERLCAAKGGYGTRTSVLQPPGLWGGLSELVWITRASIVHRVPSSLEPLAALAVPLLANGLGWLSRAGGLRPGDRVLVAGCGPQGLAAATAARISGAAEVVVTGLAHDEARLAFAAAGGARTVVADETWSRAQRLEAVGRDFDVALDLTGSATAMADAPDHVRAGGTFVMAGLLGGAGRVTFATDDLVRREVRIQPVLARKEADVRAAFALLDADPALAARLAALTTHLFPLAQSGEAIRAVHEQLPGFVKAAVLPGR